MKKKPFKKEEDMANLATCEETCICIMHQVTCTVLFPRPW